MRFSPVSFPGRSGARWLILRRIPFTVLFFPPNENISLLPDLWSEFRSVLQHL